MKGSDHNELTGTYEQAQRHLSALRRERARLALGLAQMFGAVFSLVVLITTGVNQISLSATVLTCLFTIVSVLLFGKRASSQK
jgi:hypothetical protein